MQEFGVIWKFSLDMHLKNFFWLLWVLVVSCAIFPWGTQTLPLVVAQGLKHLGSVIVARGLSCFTACGILVPWSGIEPTSPALQGGFLTTGPPGKSLDRHLNYSRGCISKAQNVSCFFFPILNFLEGALSWATVVANGLILVELEWQAIIVSLHSGCFGCHQANRHGHSPKQCSKEASKPLRAGTELVQVTPTLSGLSKAVTDSERGLVRKHPALTSGCVPGHSGQ